MLLDYKYTQVYTRHLRQAVERTSMLSVLIIYFKNFCNSLLHTVTCMQQSDRAFSQRYGFSRI